MMSDEILRHLTLYRELGLCVIPAFPRAKNPAVDWSIYQERQPTEEEYREWIDKYWSGKDPYNLGVVCGKVSGDYVEADPGKWYSLVCLDFESIDAYRQFFTKHYELEEKTMTVRSSRGIHVYFRAPSPVLSFKIPQLKLEVRAEGNFVVLPPSIHPSLTRYVLNPLVWDTRRILPVQNLVEAIWSRAEELGVKTPTEHLGNLKANLAEKAYRGPDPPCISHILEGLDEGFRNEGAVRVISYWLIFRKLDEKSVWNRLVKWNQKNRPPLEERELKACFNSVRKNRYSYGCRSNQAFCKPNECRIMEVKIEKRIKHKVTVEEII